MMPSLVAYFGSSIRLCTPNFSTRRAHWRNGEAGDAEGASSRPTVVAADSDGRILVSDALSASAVFDFAGLLAFQLPEPEDAVPQRSGDQYGDARNIGLGFWPI